jgi:uncharacterized protein YjbI with pentapeptide repeats
MERRSTKVMWTIGIVLLLLIVVLIGVWLWGVLFAFIQPETPTDKKDLVNIFVVIAAGVIGALTVIAAVGNLIISRRNLQNAQATLQQQRDTLQQQRDLDERRAQDDALQAYFEQMGDLLTEHKLMETKDAEDPLRLLARAQTLTLLERLGSKSNRAKRDKRELILFLNGAGLLKKDHTIVSLFSADLRDADLSGAKLSDADLSDADLISANLVSANLSSADLSDANLTSADLSGAILSSAYLLEVKLITAILRGADLSSADLSSADLLDASVTEEQLARCGSLAGATMPNGQKYEKWLKDKERRGKRRGKGANSTDSS